jgi:hypothetical protein
MLMAWQAAVSQTSAGFEQMQEAAKQASEVFGATMANMTEQFLQSVQDNSLKTGKRKN